jgi:tetratricopeptide (TPR) repeat protein
VSSAIPPVGPAHRSQRDHKRQISRWLRGGITAALVTVLLLVFALLRQQIATTWPALSAAVAFALFLLPGAVLTYWFLPDQSLLERLPTAFVLSTGLLIVPGVLVLTLHLSLDVFVWTFAGIAGAAIFASVLLFARHSASNVEAEPVDDAIGPWLLVVLSVLVAALCYTSLRIPLIGDDWAGMPFLQGYLAAERVNLYEPFHGTGLAPTSRSEFSVWGLVFALWSRLSGLGPIDQYRYQRPMMTLVALAAFFVLARRVLLRRSAAAFVTAFWMITLLASIAWGNPGYDLVARINQDKFSLRYIVLPVALSLLLSYFQHRRQRDLWFFGLAAWAMGGTHPMGAVLVGLPCLGFGLVHLGLERDLRTFGRLVLAALFLGTGLILPAIQLLGVDRAWLAFDLQGTTDPNLLTRLGMATRAYRLSLLPNAAYALHPAAVLQPVNLIALLGLPLLLWRLRKSLAARLLLGTFVFVPLLLYFPLTGRLIGRLITPWLLYRMAWSIPLAAALTIGWCLWAGIEYLGKRLARAGTASWAFAILPLAVLALVAGVLGPSIHRGQVYLEDVRSDPRRAQCQGVAPLLEQLPEIVKTQSIVLASHDLNFCIPAFTSQAKVLAYRWTTTLSRFPPDRRGEALQRVRDMLYYSSARFVDGELAAILARYDVRYVLIKEERLLNLQLQRLSAWFEPIAEQGGYVLYAVREERPNLLLVDANSAVAAGDLETARALYESAMEQDPGSAPLAQLGLGEIYIAQGEIARAIDQVQQAATALPTEGVLRGQLADTLMAAGRNAEAIAAYEQAISLAPTDALLVERLGHAYRVSGRTDEAREAYENAANLLAPPESARWHRLLGALYARAGWQTEALNAYRQSLAMLPRDVTVEISIGDVYLSGGQLDLARAAYQRAARLDPWNATPVMRLGMLDEKERNLAAAIRQYRRTVRMDPLSPPAYALLAEAVRVTQGEESALHSIQSTPGYELLLPGALLASGNLYVGRGDYAQAESEFTRAIERFPLDTNAVKISLGAVRLKTGQTDAAAAAYNEVLIGDPSLAADAYVGLGQVYAFQAQRGPALGSLYRAVRANSVSGAAHVALGDEYSIQARPSIGRPSQHSPST